jgi:5'-nucleotidase
MGRVRVLLTNDDGIEAPGLRALRAALVQIEGLEVAVVAPAVNQSATARSITTRRPLFVREVTFEDGTIGYAADGTPVDCVRLANLGLVEGFVPEVVVAGINHGANLGDDITYSGTVAAALEAIVLGLPAVAVSQHLRADVELSFDRAAAFAARLIGRLQDVPLAEGTLLNVNVPAGAPEGVRVARLGKRIYEDELVLTGERDGGREYSIYGKAGHDECEAGTDLAAVHAGLIAITPLHFALTDVDSIEALARYDLAALLHPTAEVAEP